MKTIMIHLEDKEYKTMLQKKGERTWKTMLMNNCGEEDGKKKGLPV